MRSRSRSAFLVACLGILAAVTYAADEPQAAQDFSKETKEQRDARMGWWRDARFGMFIHFGLYAVPAGEWKGETKHAEWIRETAHIPVAEYEKFLTQFNPTQFNADDWVRMAKDAGMQYVVITSKHHDGFCLFDSAQTDWDVMSTPFKRDIMKELSEACAKQQMRMCWYHSIMDWHHPDYLPRRGWEKAERPETGADFDRYVAYMKAELRELLTKYGKIGILWFDGEWENTWTHERGIDLYNYVRSLQPDIIINNRVDVLRDGMGGMSKDGSARGDYGTPEQEIPATGMPGVDWETCMTMNGNWGFNKADKNFKSTKQMIQMLADIASKGGNFLLNIGPRADGTFPPESVERLKEIGAWMKVNGEAIHGTQASPFKTLAWGRCTQKTVKGDTTLYLHVFDWPKDGKLVVPGLLSEPRKASLLRSGDSQPLDVGRKDDAVVVSLPAKAPNEMDSVVVLELKGGADIAEPPTIEPEAPLFLDATDVTIQSSQKKVEIRYTTDGSEPTAQSPVAAGGKVHVTQTATIKARSFRDGKAISGSNSATVTKATLRKAESAENLAAGLRFEYFEGDWDKLPDYEHLKAADFGTAKNFSLSPAKKPEHFGLKLYGFVRVPKDGIYTFYTRSDDGSRLYIGDQLVVDNDGPHGSAKKTGVVALAAGVHSIKVLYFNKSGSKDLEVGYAGPGIESRPIPDADVLAPQQTGAFNTNEKQNLEPNAKVAAARTDPATLPKPEPRQLAWQKLELIAFCHFGMNTFTDREWGEGTEDPKLFNPTDFDAKQWVSVLKDAGFKQLILTCKHHDGFCLWPSKFTEHSVKNSPWRDGKGDVVREVSDACHAAGLRFGVYLSPWDRHEPCYGDSPKYNEHFKNQLLELLTNYGPVHEVWFDGACAEGPNGKKQVYDFPAFIEVVRQYAPEAVIFSDAGPDVRWVGNENGFAGETNWSMLRRDEFYPGTPNSKPLTEGQRDGHYWVPAECDVSIRPGWFYHAAEDGKVKSLKDLMEIYYGSVGRNAVMLLNVPPDKRGRINENDVKRLREFNAAITSTFKKNLLAETALMDQPGDGGSGSPSDRNRLADGKLETFWTPADVTDGRPATLQMDGSAGFEFDQIVLQEAVASGQRIGRFHISVVNGQQEKVIATGTTIGYKRILRVPRTTARSLRFSFDEYAGKPAISEIGLYCSQPDSVPAVSQTK